MWTQKLWKGLVAGGGVVGLSGVFLRATKSTDGMRPSSSSQSVEAQSRPKLQVGKGIYSAEEVSKHDDESSLWISFEGQVYDVTEFLTSHPGARKILDAAGGDAGPYIQYWGAHGGSSSFKSMLKKYHIGSLIVSDVIDSVGIDPYKYETSHLRSFRSALSINSLRPFTAEPTAIPESYITPTGSFFIRNHAPVPDHSNMNETSVEILLETADDGQDDVVINATELKSKRMTVISTIQCTGNRISELNSYRLSNLEDDISGPNNIATAKWTGYPLTDLILKYSNENTKWVNFYASDGYEISVPISYYTSNLDPSNNNNANNNNSNNNANANNQYSQSSNNNSNNNNYSNNNNNYSNNNNNYSNNSIIAYEMNDKPLTPDHGGPFRIINPGLAGARNVKWVHTITLSSEPSTGPWQKNFYKSNLIWPINSQITSSERVKSVNGGVKISGFAYVGGLTTSVQKVELTFDSGQTWSQISMNHRPNLTFENEKNEVIKIDQRAAWRRWETIIPLNSGSSITVGVRATDSNGQTQPINPSSAWRKDGYFYNAVHFKTIYAD